MARTMIGRCAGDDEAKAVVISSYRLEEGGGT